MPRSHRQLSFPDPPLPQLSQILRTHLRKLIQHLSELHCPALVNLTPTVEWRKLPHLAFLRLQNHQRPGYPVVVLAVNQVRNGVEHAPRSLAFSTPHPLLWQSAQHGIQRSGRPLEYRNRSFKSLFHTVPPLPPLASQHCKTGTCILAPLDPAVPIPAYARTE